MNEHFVTYEQATALNALGFDIYGEYCYCTEMFCSGNNPIEFDTYSVGQRCFWHEVYSIDENGEEQERGIPCPTLAQAAAWLRRNGWHVQPMLNVRAVDVFRACPRNRRQRRSYRGRTTIR